MPQTLYIAQFLLYLNAFWMVLGILLGGGLGLLGIVALAAYVYGAYGIANEQKRGYQVAVAASFLPLALRAVLFATGAIIEPGRQADLAYVVFSTSILNVIFEYALIGLLLHPMSREHQKIWFA